MSQHDGEAEKEKAQEEGTTQGHRKWQELGADWLTLLKQSSPHYLNTSILRPSVYLHPQGPTT